MNLANKIFELVFDVQNKNNKTIKLHNPPKKILKKIKIFMNGKQ